MFGAVQSTVETFLSSKENFTSEDRAKMIAALVVVILWLVILLFLSKWLWNEVLCKIVTFTKPVTSVWQVIGLVVLLAILKPA
jgi:hypothetical protein